MAKKTYNPKNANSILKYGELLLGRSLRELHPEAVIPSGKGGLGQAVEKFHYGYKPNSDAEPDFKEAGLELKCTPLKELKKDKRTVEKIGKKRKVELNVKAKDFAYNVCRAIFNIKTRKIQEFENANISLKTIVIEANRDKIIESMSFPYIRFVDIINEEWEDSEWHKQLSGKFLFVVFRKSPDGDKRKMKLVKVFFWNMPYNDLVEAKNLWEDTKQKVCEGDYNHFITSKANGICHIRPHGTKGQTVLTPQGNRVQPKCFWLNNDYILNIVLNNIS